MILIYGLKPERSTIRGCALALTLASFFTGVAHAQSSVPLTLAEAEDLAIVSEPGQQALQASAAALAARAVVAGQLPDPTLKIGLNNYPLQSGGFSTEAMTSAGVGVRQAFPAGKTRSINFSQNSKESNERPSRNAVCTIKNTRRNMKMMSKTLA